MDHSYLSPLRKTRYAYSTAQDIWFLILLHAETPLYLCLLILLKSFWRLSCLNLGQHRFYAFQVMFNECVFLKVNYIYYKTHFAKDSKAAYWFGTEIMLRMFVGMSIDINEEMFFFNFPFTICLFIYMSCDMAAAVAQWSLAFAKQAAGWFSNPRRDRPKSSKQVVTTQLPNARE